MAKKGMRSSDLNEKHTIPKGTILKRVSTTKKENQEGSTYVSYTKQDRDHYANGYVKQANEAINAYEYTFKTKKDIEIPSRDVLIKTIGHYMKSDKDLKEICGARLKYILPKVYLETYGQAKIDEIVKGNIKSIKNQPVETAWFFAAQSLGKAENVRKKIINELRSLGYDGMIDEASVGGRMGYLPEGISPLIIFDRSDALEQVKVRSIGVFDEQDSYKRNKKNLRKYYKTYVKNDAEWSDNYSEELYQSHVL